VDHGCFSILLFFLLWNQTNFVNFWWSCLKLKFKTRLKVHIICSFVTHFLCDPLRVLLFCLLFGSYLFVLPLPFCWVLCFMELCQGFIITLVVVVIIIIITHELNFSMHNSLAKSKERMCKGVCEALLWEWWNWDPFLLLYVDNMGTILL